MFATGSLLCSIQLFSDFECMFQYGQPNASYALCSIYLYKNAPQTMGTT